jgi:hypothetical protein
MKIWSLIIWDAHAGLSTVPSQLGAEQVEPTRLDPVASWRYTAQRLKSRHISTEISIQLLSPLDRCDIWTFFWLRTKKGPVD